MSRALYALLLSAISTAVVADDLVAESSCVVFVKDDAGQVQRLELSNVHVLEQTQSMAEFVLPSDVPTKPAGLMCYRSSIVPAQGDYKVLATGIPFYVSTEGIEEVHRVLVLEISGGQFRARLLKGVLSEPEAATLQKRLNHYQDAIQE